MKRILDSSFRYTPSAQTDLRKTFARLRREQAEADKKKIAERLLHVVQLDLNKPR